MDRLVIASNNPHKVREMKKIFPDHFSVVSLAEVGHTEELEETTDTIEGNSLQKAEFVYKKFGLPCISDDSGLEVDSLDGEPGVYSAMYAGDQRSSEDNINLLLKNLSDKADRSAQFKTVITLVSDQETLQFEGIVRGRIIEEKRGSNGFGYDPVFIPDEYEQTFAELSDGEKNSISHRARAIHKLLDHIKENYG